MASDEGRHPTEESVPLLVDDDPVSSSSTAAMSHELADSGSMKAQTDFREDIDARTPSSGYVNEDRHVERVEVTEEDVRATQSAKMDER